MLTQTIAIARNAFVESLRQPVMLLIILLSGVLQIFNTWNTGFAMGLEESGEVEGDNKLLLDVGLATVFVCATILAAFIATATLSREIENKTVLTVVSKPIGRPVVVVGKYVGVAAAILVSVGTMLLFLLLCIRHGVLSTASDDPDMPVILYGLLSVFIALCFAAWCNFFYGWSFPQVAAMSLLPLVLIAYLLVLKTNKKWEWQDMARDFKPQITMASASLAMGVLVLTAVAIAASARLGQVMTVFVCLGVFLASLLSNYYVGRHAFHNEAIGVIRAAGPLDIAQAAFSKPGDTYLIELRVAPRELPALGSPIYYGENSNGFDMAVPPYEPFAGDITRAEQALGPTTPPALAVVEAANARIAFTNIGATPLQVRRPPQVGDYVFNAPTRINSAALAIWGAFPNMHYFWLLDAVSQNQIVPWSHVELIALYGTAQVISILALAVVLFQKRDVG